MNGAYSFAGGMDWSRYSGAYGAQERAGRRARNDEGSKVSVSGNTNMTVLQLVAQEERKLLERIEEARSEARHIVDEAAVQARTILEESRAAIAREIAEMRRAGEREAAEERAAIWEKAEGALAEARAQAQGHAKQVVEDVVHSIIPGEGKKAV